MLRRNLRLKTAAIVVLAGLVILAGVAVGVVRLVDTVVPGYRTELADWVGERLGQPLAIGRMDLTWGWSGPVLRLADVNLLEDAGDETVLRLDALALQFAFTDLLRGRTMPEGMALVGPRLTIARGPEGDFRLRGLSDRGAGGEFDLGEAGGWLQQLERIRIIDGRVRVTATDALTGPIELADVTLALSNRGPRHRLNAQASVESAPGGSIDLQVFVLGDLAEPGSAEIHAYVGGEGLSGPRLLALAGLDSGRLRGGRSDVEVWADWADGRFAGARASVGLSTVRAPLAGGEVRTLAPAMSLDASAQAEGDRIRLQLDRLESSAFDGSAVTGDLRLDPDSGRVRGTFTGLPATLAAAGLRVWRPGTLGTARADGRLPRLAVDRSRENGWHLLAEFADLRLEHGARGLSLGRFDGRVTLGRRGGTLRLAGGEGAIEWARYINGELPLADISGEIAWEPADAGRVVRVTDLRAVSGATTASGGGHLRLPAKSAAEADLSFRVQSDDIGPLLDRIPQAEDLPNPRLRHWLPDAIPAGRIESASLRLRGPLDRFPFADGGGTFRVEAEGEGVNLAYKPGWPVLEDIAGTLTLEGDTLDIRARRGRMLGVSLDPAHAHIPDVREPILAVNGGVAEADAAAMLRFLPNSPLAEKFGRLAEVLTVDGRAGLALDLSVPLKPGLGELALDGRIRLAGVDLNHEVLPQPIRSIRGEVRFDRKGLYADGLEGEFAGLPVTAGFTPADGDALAIDASALMRLPRDASALEALLPPALLARASGETVWRTALLVSPGGRVSDLKLSSDLAGLALDLPAPLGKAAQPAAPVELTLAGDRSRANLDYAERLRAEARLADGRLQALDLLFGATEASAPAGPGLWLGGSLPVVDVAAWRELAADLKGGDGPGLALRGADVQAAGLRLDGQRVGPLSVDIAPMTVADGWQARVTGEGAAGTVRWFSGAERPHLDANFERIALQAGKSPPPDADASPEAVPEAEGEDEPDPAMDPASLPTLALSVTNLRVAGSDLGRLRVTANGMPDGLALETLQLDGEGVTLSGDGRWTRSGGRSEAVVNTTFSGSGIERVLQAMGYAATLRATTSDVEAELRFAPHPDGLEPAALNGRLSFGLENGTLMAVEPGAGRVLGLVNFYALPRRLLLDFRDVVGEGMAFDSLRGDFRIDSGDAHTDNLRINTPSATIRIRGRIGLAARDYDQRVTIVPKTSSAAAIAGTVLGGPAVGAALFVAQRLLRKPIAEISSVTYHLTGSWENPRIEPIESEDASG